MAKWITSSPGVLSYGDTGFIVRYVPTDHTTPWHAFAPSGRRLRSARQENAIRNAEHMHRELVAVGLAEGESKNDG